MFNREMNSKKKLVREIKVLKKQVEKYYKTNKLKWINKELWIRQFNEAKRLDDLQELAILKEMLNFILYYFDNTVSLIKYPYIDDNVNFDELGPIEEYFIRNGESPMDFATLRHLASGLYDILVSAEVVSQFGYY